MASPRLAFSGDVNALGGNGDSLAYTPAPAGLPFLGGGSAAVPTGARGGLGGGNTSNNVGGRPGEEEA